MVLRSYSKVKFNNRQGAIQMNCTLSIIILKSKYKTSNMSRFMIDVNYQNNGFGKKALEKFMEFFINKYGHLPL